MRNKEENKSMLICMHAFSFSKAYQNEATAKQAIAKENRQNFTLKINLRQLHQAKTCDDKNS